MEKSKTIFSFSIALVLLLSIGFALSGREPPSSGGGGGGSGGGGTEIPILDIALTERGEVYNLSPTRLRFRPTGWPYALQLNHIEPDYAEFLVIVFEKDNLEEYKIKETFNLTIGESKEAELDWEEGNDMFIELIDINTTGIDKAEFFIKKI